MATLVDKAPEGSDWAHEIKFDGYRIMALIHNEHIRLKSRNNKDWTNDLSSVVDALQELALPQVIFDGEVVLLDEHGKSDFQLLQNTIKSNTKAPFIYYLFDILYFDQFDLRTLPLLKRKAILKNLLEGQDKTLRFSDHIIGEGGFLFHRACELGLEGIISKQIDSPYISGRSKRWLKIKCLMRQEFVICGYSVPTGSRKYFRALYLGVYNEQGELDYTGNVGTGFTESSLKDIFSRLQKLITKQNPFNQEIPDSKGVVWVQPQLVAEIEFTHWTERGHLRHPSFKGLRLDKKPKDVFREQKVMLNKKDEKMQKQATKNAKAHSFKISHPDKVLYPEDAITKKDLLHYYEYVCDYIMPFISNRPLSLLRCPENWHDCFFQRHYIDSTPKVLKAVSIEAKEGKEEKEPYVYLNTTEGLFSLVQMNVLEIHPWGSLITHIEKPDFIVFDLDPGPSVTWEGMVKAAFEIRKYLDEFKLTSFVKTTGGKGLHVVVPIEPEYHWDEVKNFTQVFAGFMEQVNPEKYTSTMSKAKRKGKIFVDFLRNQRGATAIGPYSTRARLHAPVAVPIHWDELSKEKRDTEFTIKTLPTRLKRLKNDPWEDYWKIKQSLRLNSIL
ncbi:Putative DNA ligase-like protein Rv0938/MT0965 [Legionella steigerwaltii]|uniref:DNA ligase (ATP) n=1 Tax=Legionella steigerwaltii TaxID=460 RepID=A0A378L8Q2_9GAMM|nr:DNA ligase D [Legionella steigerwaltii]KTD77412.1 putative ATP-dependent DNA ligase YkoU [Legionella steigerwaltii]STY22292.1 Putative DNA ligase-like protein Rv0938/MT0965 [Legionella steigerwaltii]